MIRWFGGLLIALTLLTCAWLWWNNYYLPVDSSATQQRVSGNVREVSAASTAALPELFTNTNSMPNDDLQQKSLNAETDIGVVSTQLDDTDKAFSCDKLTDPNELAGFSFVRSWIDSHFYTQNLRSSYYDQLEQEQLLAEARAGDVLAMRTLARNYKWFASHQQYNKPDRQESNNLDREALGQARYWLQQAALSGYLGAFVEMSTTYFLEIRHLSRQKQDQTADIEALEAEIADLHILMQGNIALGLEVVPLLRKLAPHLEASLQDALRTPEQQQQFEYSFEALLQRWQADRTERGLPAQIEIDVPVEVLQWTEYNNAHFNCMIQANRKK